MRGEEGGCGRHSFRAFQRAAGDRHQHLEKTSPSMMRRADCSPFWCSAFGLSLILSGGEEKQLHTWHVVVPAVTTADWAVSIHG